MTKSLYTIITFARINTRRFFRDKLAIFFGILFPLLFLFIFAGIFGKNDGVHFTIALVNQSKSAFTTQFVANLEKEKVFQIEKLSMADAVEKAKRTQVDAIVVLPENFGEVTAGSQMPSGQATIQYTQNQEQSGTALVTAMQGIFKGINQGITKAPEPFTVKGEVLKNKSLTSLDYMFAGLLGFSLLGIGIFGPVNVFPELKKQGILRRLSTTPLKVWQYFTSMVISQIIIGLVSIAAMFVVAISVFKLQVVGNPIELLLFLIFSITVMLGIGLALGGWAKNERQAAPLSNIVTFPMMFLSGTFFPRFLMPEWLQNASSFLPLTPIIDGIRYIVTEGYHLTQLGPQLGIMAAWIVVIYLIAFKVFRWE